MLALSSTYYYNYILYTQRQQGEKKNIPTPFSLIICCALALAADVMAGDGCEEAAAKEPKRRENMDAMVGDSGLTRGAGEGLVGFGDVR